MRAVAKGTGTGGSGGAVICARCGAWLPEPRPSCAGCGWRLPAVPMRRTQTGVQVVVTEQPSPLSPREQAWALLEAGGSPHGALLLIDLAARRLELVIGLAWEQRFDLAELRAELRERVAPLLAEGATEAAAALAQRLLMEAALA